MLTTLEPKFLKINKVLKLHVKKKDGGREHFGGGRGPLGCCLPASEEPVVTRAMRPSGLLPGTSRSRLSREQMRRFHVELVILLLLYYF